MCISLLKRTVAVTLTILLATSAIGAVHKCCASSTRPLFVISYHALDQDPMYWRHDLKLMLKAGFNVVRVFYVSPKNFDASKLDAFLRLCDDVGMKVIVTIAFDANIPHLLAKSQNGFTFPTFPSFANSEFIEYFKAFTKKVVEVSKKHKCVIAYNIFNEPHYFESGYFDNNVADYSEASVKAFRSKYGIDPPEPPSTYEWWLWNASEDWVCRWRLWRIFHAETLTKAVEEIAKYVKELDPERPVLVNEMPWFLWSQGSYAGVTPLHPFTARNVDMVGVDIYPAEVRGEWIALALSTLRAAVSEKKLFVYELNHKSGDATPYMIAYWHMLALLFSNSDVIGWFEWDARFAYMDGGDYGVVTVGKSPRDVYYVLKRVHETVSELYSELSKIREAYWSTPPQVAIVYPMETGYITSGDWPSAFSMLGMFWALVEQGYRVDIVISANATPETLSKYRAVILVGAPFVEEELVKNLESYVKGGGTLICDVYSLRYIVYSNGTVHEAPKEVFRKLFGIELLKLHYTHTLNKLDTGVIAAIDTKSTYLTTYSAIARVKVLTARTFGRFEDGSPAITVNRYGSGTAVYVATSLYPALTQKEWGIFLKSLLEIIAKAQPSDFCKYVIAQISHYAEAITNEISTRTIVEALSASYAKALKGDLQGAYKELNKLELESKEKVIEQSWTLTTMTAVAILALPTVALLLRIFRSIGRNKRGCKS